MTTEPIPEPALPQPRDDLDLRVLQEALSRAYEQARQGGYRAGSPEMDALRQAESRYQQTKTGWRHGAARPGCGAPAPLGSAVAGPAVR